MNMYVPSKPSPLEWGTLIYGLLLIVAIGFTGYWIFEYSGADHPPWPVMWWFGCLVMAVIVGSLLVYVGPRWRKRPR